VVSGLPTVLTLAPVTAYASTSTPITAAAPAAPLTTTGPSTASVPVPPSETVSTPETAAADHLTEPQPVVAGEAPTPACTQGAEPEPVARSTRTEPSAQDPGKELQPFIDRVVLESRRARKAEAKILVSRHALVAMGFGFLPLPIIDAAAVSTVQYNLLQALCRHYEIDCNEQRARSILSSIVGGTMPFLVSVGAISTFFKALPVVGITVGLASMAGLSNVSTRIIGYLFIDHFEKGGSLSDFRTEEMREKYLLQMREKTPEYP
jgi:uncharacterized protein (DUF697 family)